MRRRRPYRDHREDRSAGLCHARYAEIADIEALFDELSQFVYSQGSTALDSGHRHSTRWIMAMHAFNNPLVFRVAEGIAATAKKGSEGRLLLALDTFL